MCHLSFNCTFNILHFTSQKKETGTANQKKKMRHGDKDDVTKEEDPLEKLETFHHEILQTAVKECADLQAQVLNFFGDSEYGRELRAALEESDTESDSD